MEEITLSPEERVLFVCSANKNRSPMAAAVFSTRMEERGFSCRVDSAGLDFGLPVAHQWGELDESRLYWPRIKGRIGRRISFVPWTPETLFICLDAEIRERAADRLSGMVRRSQFLLLYPPDGVYDPEGSIGLGGYRLCLSQIEAGVDTLTQQLML